MVAYEITCDKCHAFEGRFRSAEDYTLQLSQGLLACPVCASRKLKRRPQNEPIVLKREVEPELLPGGLSPWLQQLRDHLAAYSDVVLAGPAADDSNAIGHDAAGVSSESVAVDELAELLATPMGPEDTCH